MNEAQQDSMGRKKRKDRKMDEQRVVEARDREIRKAKRLGLEEIFTLQGRGGSPERLLGPGFLLILLIHHLEA